ncbi:sortase [Dactylosporangium matsuzakiense]|uniref:Sortase n=1 Tax=Dactylosporangium matsuzakiense TaxID=53360 RepID=A0A9W6KMA8_9ACTN|nr:sortase [Dactylosporangium matsuzakiense]UWZ45943.1 sortase [Dactylosporangium matsuzakiense]GLL02886.1 sortase [Dactylosporangium matsuzakiense]
MSAPAIAPPPEAPPIDITPSPVPYEPPRRPRRQATPAVQVITTAITLLSLTLLGFGGYAGFLSRLHHDREQLTAYADFRKDLALGLAPTGQIQPEHPEKLLDLGTPVAVIDIPKLHRKEVVFEGTTGAVLQKGPGHRRDTPLPGQAGVSVIMGRATTYGGPFGGLQTLLPGDEFTVVTGQGEHRFTVLGVRHGGMPVPPAPAAGKGRLVLTTAYGGMFAPTDALRVDADLTSEPKQSPSRRLATSQLYPAEQVMAIDTGVWFPLVFVGEGLLLAVALVSAARAFWGVWQAWIVAVPVVGYLGIATADYVSRLLPNLI